MSKRIQALVGGFLLLAVAACNQPEQSITAGGRVIRFELERNRMILPVTVGTSDTLRVILDSGMPFDGLYLFHKEMLDQVALPGSIEVRVPGAGAGEASTAIMTDSGTFRIGGMEFSDQRIIVSQSDHTQSFATDGVLGYTLLGRGVVAIDFDRLEIAVYDSALVLDSTWSTIPFTLRDNIPFLDIGVIVGDDTVTVGTYMDIAAGEALEILVREDMKVPVPVAAETVYLGTGLSGDFHGRVGRIDGVVIGSYVLSDVVAAFPQAEIRSKQGDADAIIGNDLLRRFNVVFDYGREQLHLKPNEAFGEAFVEVAR